MDHVTNFFGKGTVREVARRHLRAAVAMFIGFTVACTAAALIEPGAVTYVLGFPALVLILVTALARLNDIDDRKTGTRWQLRRIWLLSVMTGAAFLIFMVPTWPVLFLLWGIAGTWLTTPGQPPWHIYLLRLFGEDEA